MLEICLNYNKDYIICTLTIEIPILLSPNGDGSALLKRNNVGSNPIRSILGDMS